MFLAICAAFRTLRLRMLCSMEASLIQPNVRSCCFSHSYGPSIPIHSLVTVSGLAHICTFRAGPDVFAAISVFHFGIMAHLKMKPHDSHWEEGYSPFNTSDRIAWLPHFMRSVARHTFPELCTPNRTACHDPEFFNEYREDPKLSDNTPPLFDSTPESAFWFPFPSIIVAQSAAWDIKRMGESGMNLHRANMPVATAEWRDTLQREVWDPLLRVFGSTAWRAVSHLSEDASEVQRSTRFYTRTVPLAAEGAWLASTAECEGSYQWA
ncbi:hypothetical protein BC830DRAFT_1154929 [Chytriomyces sp. MP71]|nr:hypothetical protein BC830DRAFT_1154929 [Chytriomyces sp. MP71]